MLSSNYSPFSDRGMITNRERFFGRTPQLQSAFSALAAEKPQCVCVLGERRIGRSSFLNHIQQTYKDHLPNPKRYRFAYINLLSAKCKTKDGFRAELAKELFRQTDHALTPHQFDDLLTRYNPSRNTKYVVLLDEFPTLQKNKEEFNDDFYDNLRSLADAGDIAWVVATHQPLQTIAKANKFNSTFFGIFQPVSLDNFQREEAEASIFRQENERLQENAFDEITKWLDAERDSPENPKYHPLKLNIAADLLWQNHPVTHHDHDRLRKAYKEQVDHHLAHDVRRVRRRNKMSVGMFSGADTVMDWIEGHIKGLTIIVGAVLVGAFLLFGTISRQELTEMGRNWLKVPTHTPTVTMSPTTTATLTMTPTPTGGTATPMGTPTP